MTEETRQVLTKHEWVEQPARARMKFRRDSTGFYEREAGSGSPLIHENFLHRFEEGQLHLKFAHAREWTQVGAELRSGDALDGERLGRWRLVLARDAYSWLFEERDTGELVLFSDSGAALLG